MGQFPSYLICQPSFIKKKKVSIFKQDYSTYFLQLKQTSSCQMSPIHEYVILISEEWRGLPLLLFNV